MFESSRSRLPAFHISRPRLTGGCADARIVVVEAAGGYGKSVLGAEMVDAWGALAIWVLLEESGVSARLLVARLHNAVSRVGLTDAAAAMATLGDDPAGAIDAMLTVLDGETCAIVIDDAHNADREAAELIARISAQRGESVRLVVLARQIPAGAERLRRPESLLLTARDLALRPEETLELCRTGFGLAVSGDDGRRLDAATGGWTAAAVLTASRARRLEVPLTAVMGDAASGSDSLRAVLQEVLAAQVCRHRCSLRWAVCPYWTTGC